MIAGTTVLVLAASALLLTPEGELWGSSTHALGVVLLVTGAMAAMASALVLTSRETEARLQRRRTRA